MNNSGFTAPTDIQTDFSPTLAFEAEKTSYNGQCVSQISNLKANTAALEALACNINTPINILLQLVAHDKPQVRAAIAENRNAPLESIYLLANDCDPDVRYQVAEMHHIPREVLHLMTMDDNPYVSCRAVKTLSRIDAEHQTGRKVEWNEFRRVNSLQGLGELSDTTGVPALVLLRRLYQSFTKCAKAV